MHNSLNAYRELIINANENINLVSRRNVHKISESLISESLIPLEWNICRLRSPMLDIGTGAGIPGIPLKIANPEIELILLDSNRKKTLFIRKAISTLKLSNIYVENCRAEDFALNSSYSGYFNTIVSRAAVELGDLLKWGNVLLKSQGELIVWKGSEVMNELKFLNLNGWNGPDFWYVKDGPTIVRLEK